MRPVPPAQREGCMREWLPAEVPLRKPLLAPSLALPPSQVRQTRADGRRCAGGDPAESSIMCGTEANRFAFDQEIPGSISVKKPERLSRVRKITAPWDKEIEIQIQWVCRIRSGADVTSEAER